MNQRGVTVATAVGVALTICYAVTMLPGLGWDDTPELALAIDCYGVPHSPGFAPFVTLGRCVKELGGVSGAQAATWVSALAGASAAALLAGFVSGRWGWLLGAAAGLGLGLSPVVWLQATQGEVYTLHLLWATILLCLTFTAAGPRVALGAGYVFGIGVWTHPSIIGFAPLLWPFLRTRLWAWLSGGMILGLSVVVVLPLRSSCGPFLDWGHTHTPAGFLWMISLREFHADALTGRLIAGGTMTGAIETIGSFLSDALAPLTLGLAAVALPAVAWAAPRVVASCAGLAVLTALGGAGPDVSGYLLPVCSAALIAASATLGALRLPPWAGGLALMAGTFLLCVPEAPGLNRSHDRSSSSYQNALASQVEGRILFTDSSTDLFLMLEKGFRGDSRLQVVYTPYLGLPWYRSSLTPALASLLPAEPDPPYETVVRAAERLRTEPVFTFHQLPPGARGHLVPEGWVFRAGSYDSTEDWAMVRKWPRCDRAGSHGERLRALRLAQGGQLLAARGQYGAAVSRLSEATTSDPLNAPMWHALVSAYAVQGNCESLVRSAEAYLRLAGLTNQDAGAVVLAMDRLRTPCPRATALADSLLRTSPDMVGLAAPVARRALADGDPAMALRVLDRVKGVPAPELLNLEGVSLMLLGRLNEAASVFERGMEHADSLTASRIGSNLSMCLRFLTVRERADSNPAATPGAGP